MTRLGEVGPSAGPRQWGRAAPWNTLRWVAAGGTVPGRPRRAAPPGGSATCAITSSSATTPAGAPCVARLVGVGRWFAGVAVRWGFVGGGPAGARLRGERPARPGVEAGAAAAVLV